LTFGRKKAKKNIQNLEFEEITMANVLKELKPEDLRKRCDPEQFGFETTAEIKGSTEVIAQERAVAAIRFGVGMKDFGYNLYVAGVPGTGKTSTVKAFVSEEAKKEKVPSDWCYVNNFENPDHPLAIRLPPGKAIEFQKDMNEFISDCRRGISRAFEDKDYEGRRKKILDDFQKERDTLIEKFQKTAQAGCTRALRQHRRFTAHSLVSK
jgi:hypothetical protein